MDKILLDNKIYYLSKIYDLDKMSTAEVRELAEHIGKLMTSMSKNTQRRLEALQSFCYDYANSREEK